jgi:hypothetical protein
VQSVPMSAMKNRQMTNRHGEDDVGRDLDHDLGHQNRIRHAHVVRVLLKLASCMARVPSHAHS